MSGKRREERQGRRARRWGDGRRERVGGGAGAALSIGEGCVRGSPGATVDAEDLLIDDCGEREAVEDVAEDAPQLDVVATLALVIEACGAEGGRGPRRMACMERAGIARAGRKEEGRCLRHRRTHHKCD